MVVTVFEAGRDVVPFTILIALTTVPADARKPLLYAAEFVVGSAPLVVYLIRPAPEMVTKPAELTDMVGAAGTATERLAVAD